MRNETTSRICIELSFLLLFCKFQQTKYVSGLQLNTNRKKGKNKYMGGNMQPNQV